MGTKYKYDPQDKIRKQKKRAYIRHNITELKMSNFCQMCKLEDPEHPEIYDFDHQGNKKQCVSNLIQSAYAWEHVLEEVKKCQILCSNCHRIKTAKDRKNVTPQKQLKSNQVNLF